MTVDDYIRARPRWADALQKLRALLLATDLEESIKWNAPNYALDGKNVIGLAAFTDYVCLWFHQGVFLEDPDSVLQNAQAGKTKGLRQWRFADVGDIKVSRVRAYVREAIQNQRAGKVIRPSREQALVMPTELTAALAKRPKARRAFDALTPGRQREYASHIAEAKQAKTKATRIDKVLPMIEAGVGLHDKYRDC